jgi:hypothetical protein
MEDAMAGDRKPFGYGDLVSEARRILRKLQGKGAYLSKLSVAAAGTANLHGVFTPRDGYRRPAATVERHFVHLFTSEGWIEKADKGSVLSKGGATWLKRQAAGDDGFRQQHQLLSRKLDEDRAGVRRSLLINDAESPLGWLRKRKGRNGAPLIDDYQYAAGERLRYDFWLAQMTPSVTTNWSMPASPRRGRRAAPEGHAMLRDGAIAAKRRIIRALEAVGPELAGLVLDVCCYLQGLEEAEKLHGWPQRSGKVVLQLALTRLARHYGIVGKARISTSIRDRIRHWGESDYRPNLQSWV